MGGTAFLSSEVAREAMRRGHEVTCLARGSKSTPPDDVEWIHADRDDGPGVYPARDWDVVVDVARHPIHVRDAVEALGGRTGHWTLVSSCSVYADHSVPGEDESAQLLPASTGDHMESMEVYGEAKVACESAVGDLGDSVHICRSGLIGGRGDPSDRFGYWPARFARHGDDQVLVPDVATQTQVISVGDLASWILSAAENEVVGIFNAVGDPMPLSNMLVLIQATVSHTGEQVRVPPEWLEDHDVAVWSGENSLPLWLHPGEFDGFCARSNQAARKHGMRLSDPKDLILGSLSYERELGIDRPRSAGLDPAREAELLQLLADG